MWNGKIETGLLRNEQRCAGARRGCHVGQPAELPRLALLEHVDEPLTAADVDPLACRIVEEIVGVADDVERTGLPASTRVAYENLGGPAASNKHPVVLLVERQREVRFRAANGPYCNHLHRGSINDRNLIRVRNVHEYARPRVFELK